MIRVNNTETYGWEAAIRGMRNPMNSWEKSDSYATTAIPSVWFNNAPRDADGRFLVIGENDLDLMMRLRNAGTDHRKFMRMIMVSVNITAPLYWWKEFDTYKVGTVANSCSTMHKITEREFVLDDFSHEHLLNFANGTDDSIYIEKDGTYNSDTFPGVIEESMHDEILYAPMSVLDLQIKMLNKCRDLYLKTKDKVYWWQMIQLLPSSYNQKRTVMLNYEVLANIYKSRKNHKLDEWHDFCDWIETLPHFELITGRK